MADLFQKDVRTISEHIRNTCEEGELRPEAVVRNFRTTAADNKPREIRSKADATAICSEGHQDCRRAQATRSRYG